MVGGLEFWRQLPAHISPVIIKLGALELRWYGLCYFLAIFVAYLLSSWRIRHQETQLTQAKLEDYFFWVIFGVVIGARLGYVLFYQWSYYSAHLLEVFLPIQFEGGLHFTGISGLSFHGGWLGSIFATWLFCRKNKISFWSSINGRHMIFGTLAKA